MAKVRPITQSGKPIRKCPACGLRTSLQTCPSSVCRNKKTIVVTDEGSIAKK